MFKRILMWGIALLFLSNYASAQNPIISGGNYHSVVICDDGVVYTWGRNYEGTQAHERTGTLGRVTFSEHTSIPDKVIFPNDVQIASIDAGSGAHTVAITCEGEVWTWGGGASGQLGNGLKENSVTPVQVLAGETNTANPTSKLIGISYVTASTDATFAVTADKKLVSWGGGGTIGKGNELGSGNRGYVASGAGYNFVNTGAASSVLPVFVRDSKGKPLENVIAVTAGDWNVYAIVDDDNDGDPTTGRVYAFGTSYGGDLAVISAADELKTSSYARLVVDADKKPLTGISMVSAADPAGFFMQKNTGFVFSVGGGDMGIRGVGIDYPAPDYAEKVLSGELKTITGDDYLSGVKEIAGGQIHAVAHVEINGKSYAMTWGSNTRYGDTPKSGALGHKYYFKGNGTATSADNTCVPGFVRNCDGSIMENVISVSRGDGNSYVITKDPITGEKQVWVWGQNTDGQVGLGQGSTEDKKPYYDCPQKLKIPCAVADPCPIADLGPASMFVCPTDLMAGIELYAGAEGKFLSYKWELIRANGVAVDMTSRANKNDPSRLVIRAVGTYRVSITDETPPNQKACGSCPVSVDEIIVEKMLSPFTDKSTTYCGDNIQFSAELKPNTKNVGFFGSESTTDLLGTGIVSGSRVEISVPLKDAEFVPKDPTDATSKDQYRIWIEDQTVETGTILNKMPVGCTNHGSLYTNQIGEAGQLFSFFGDVYINSATIRIEGTTEASKRTATFTPVIRVGAKNSQNIEIPGGILLKLDPQTITRGAVQGTFYDTEIKFELNGEKYLFEGNAARPVKYWISMETTSQLSVQSLCKGTDIPYVDDIDGSTMRWDSYAEGTNPNKDRRGVMYKIKLEKPSTYTCGRDPLYVYEECPPCHGIVPESLIASVSKDMLCPGQKASLSFTAKPLPVADAKKIKYEWALWDGVVGSKPLSLNKTGFLGTLSSASAFEDNRAGYYIVKLYDEDDVTNSQCVFSDTVRVDTATTPKYNFSVGQTLCEGDAFTTIDLNLTGFGPWTVTLDGAVKTVGVLGDLTGKYTITPTAAHDYKLTAIEDNFCEGNTVGGDTAKVVVNALPTSTFANPDAVCVKSEAVDVTSLFKPSVTNVKLNKTVYSDTDGHLSASGVFTVPYVKTATVFTLDVNYEDINGCKNNDKASITVNPTPTVTLSLNDKYCSEESIDYASGASLSGGVFSVIPTLPLSGGSIDASALNHKTDYTFSYKYIDANGCDTTVSDKTYAIIVPEIVDVTDYSVAGVKAGDVVSGDLIAKKSDVNATINWIDSDGIAMTGGAYLDKETINVSHTATSASSAFVYKAFQTMEGCVGKSVDVTFSISPCSALVPIVENKYFCADEIGKQITASLDPTRTTDQIGWIDASLGASGFLSISSYADAKVTGSASKTISQTAAGEYKYYVAAWEETNQCWSSAKEVTFIVKPNPTASIESQAKVACYNYDQPKPITVSPFHNAAGITSVFTVDNVVESVPQYLPSKKSTGGTMTLTYKVDSLITPTGYASPKTCESNLAKEEYKVEFVSAPTSASVSVPVSQHPYTALVATGDAGNKFNWYTSAVEPRTPVATSASYDPSKGVKYDEDIKFTVYVTQVTDNECESIDTTVFQELIKCKHKAPIAEGFEICENILDGTSVLSLTATSPAQSADAVYTWYDGATELGTGTTFIPTMLSVGKHTVQVGVVDWTDPVLLPGKTCPSPRSEVTYEIFKKPTPTISGVVEDMCIYDNSITLKGQDDGGNLHPNGKGVFTISNATDEIGSSYSFSPSVLKEGNRTISFTYTTEEGCTEKSKDYSITVHEVPSPVIDVTTYDVPQIDEILLAPYNGKFTFTGTPTASDYSLQWFTVKPLVISSATSANSGNSFVYILDPQPVNRVDVADEYSYTVFVNQKMTSPIACYSNPIDVKITTTDCPTPKPTVKNSIACDYWTGTSVPALIGTRSDNWGSYPADNNTSLYKTVSNVESLSADGKHVFTDISVPSKTYSVEYRVYSPLYNCYSPKVTATLDVKSIAKATITKGDFSTCFDDISDRTFEAATVAGQTITWYPLADSSSTPLGLGSKYTVNPAAASQTVYASMKMNVAPYCESNPAQASSKITVNPIVESPNPTDNIDQCASSYDIAPNSNKPLFPSSKVDYLLTADPVNPSDEIQWRLTDNNTAKLYNTGTLIVVGEDDAKVNLKPGEESELYAYSVRKYGSLECYSEAAKAVIKPKPTPNMPSKISTDDTQNGEVTFVCQGSNDAAPVYEVMSYSDLSEVKWYDADEYELALALGIAPTVLSTTTSLDLSEFIESGTAGTMTFIATDELDGCISAPTSFKFEIAAKPVPLFERDAYYYCEDPAASVNLAVYTEPEKEGDEFIYDWKYSSEDGDAAEFVTTDSANIKRWFYTHPGIDEASVKVTNVRTGCAETTVVRLYVAEKVTPRFESEVYSGPQEIVFRNQMTTDSVSGVVWDLDKIEYEPYTTRYNWTFIHNTDQSVRKMVQMDSTRTDRKNNLYYVNRGPSDYDSVIVFEDTLFSDFFLDTVLVYTSQTKNVDGKTVGVRVSEVDGKKVKVHGGVPFKYGTSTVTLTRDVYTLDGIPYDTRSCRVTSPEVEVFMPITTGLFVPTSFAPGHASPLVAVFKPYGNKIADFKIWVYDNWGNTVFYSDKLNDEGQPLEAWDGRDKAGNPLPSDSYYWKVDATFEDGTKWEGNLTENGKKKAMGNVFLIR